MSKPTGFPPVCYADEREAIRATLDPDLQQSWTAVGLCNLGATQKRTIEDQLIELHRLRQVAACTNEEADCGHLCVRHTRVGCFATPQCQCLWPMGVKP